MKRVFLLIGILMISSCDKPSEEIAMQQILDNAVRNGIPGISAAIATKDGVIWTGVAGKAHVSENILVNENHLFPIGSITKTFVAVVTLQLVEEGRLSLEQTPMDILGEDIVGKVPGTDKATIAQLLNHTSGIPSWEDDPKWIKEGRGEKLNVKRLWKRTDTLPYIEQTPLTNQAGEKFSYANTNHTLIGLIIEKITGHDVIDEIRNRILIPVGISDIYLEGFQNLPKDRLSSRYHYATPEFKRDAGVAAPFKPLTDGLIDVSSSNLSVEWVAGGMVASASDLVKYASAFRNGKLLNPESMAFVQEYIPFIEHVEVGHGVFSYTHPEKGYSFLGHEGSVLGGTGGLYWHEKEDIAVVIIANVGTMHIGQKRASAYSTFRNSNFMALAIKYSHARKN